MAVNKDIKGKPVSQPPQPVPEDWRAVAEDRAEQYGELQARYQSETSKLRRVIVGIASAAPVVGLLGYFIGKRKGDG